MKPNVYADISLRANTGLLIPVLAGRVVEALHPAMARHPGCFALAFPYAKQGPTTTPGHHVRVFATDRTLLEGALDIIECETLRECVHAGRIRDVPADWAGNFVAYERFRIPSRRGKGTPEQMSKRQRIRHKRLAQARDLPFVKVHSKSTGQLAVLTFTTLIAPNKGLSGQPDAYGLSRPQATVWLPFIER